jgi:hypothetical protein
MPASPTVRERKNRRFQRAKEIDQRLSLLHHLDEKTGELPFIFG